MSRSSNRTCGSRSPKHVIAIAACLLAGALLGAVRPIPASDRGVASPFDLYAAGKHEAALLLVDPKQSIDAFQSMAKEWISIGPDVQNRGFLVAAITLEIVWLAALETSRLLAPWEIELTEPDPSNRANSDPSWFDRTHSIADTSRPLQSNRHAAARLIAWARGHLPTTGTPTPAERAWWMAAVGVLEESRAWLVLESHLGAARLRLPEEPRIQLSNLIRQVRILATASGPDLRHTRRPDSIDRLTDRRLSAGSLRRLKDLKLQLTTFRSVPSMAAEASLHSAYIDLVANEWKGAIIDSQAALVATDEPLLRAVGEYFSGWAWQKLGQPAEAVSSYQRAFEAAPANRNVGVLLAQQLVLAGRSAQATEALDAIFRATVQPTDLVTQFERSDARLVPSLVQVLRKSFR